MFYNFQAVDFQPAGYEEQNIRRKKRKEERKEGKERRDNEACVTEYN